jgi:hypothetical protein
MCPPSERPAGRFAPAGLKGLAGIGRNPEGAFEQRTGAITANKSLREAELSKIVRRPGSASLAMWLVLAVGAGLRFYHLGMPSQWWDEILVPLTASHPLAYILDFCRSSEMHPPLFYFIIKAVMAAGTSDFALRFLPALLGTLTLYALYRVVWSFTDQGTALLAMALLAVNGLNILVSREIRPYTLQIFALAWTWYFLVRLLRQGRWRDFAALCAVNAGLFWLHYFTFHMVAAQFLVLVVGRFALGSRVRLSRLAVFCLVSLALALPVFVFFFLPSSGSQSIFTDTQYSRQEVWELIRDYLGQSLYFFGKTWPRVVLLGLCALGTWVLAWRDRMVLAATLILGTLPLVNVLLMGKAAYFSPWHVAYTALFTSFLAAMGLARLTPRPARQGLALVLAMGLAMNILLSHSERYYEPDSYRHRVFVTLYKPVARSLAAMLPPDGLVTCSDPGFANACAWYLNRYTTSHPLTVQTLGPEQAQAIWSFISAHGDFGNLAKDEPDLLAKFGQPLSVAQAQNAKVYTFALARRPATVIEALPFQAALPATPPDFYRLVQELRDLRYCPGPGLGLTATSNDHPGVFHYLLVNQAGPGPQTIFVNLFYRNAGRGNQLGLYYQFDDEPLTPVAGSLGPDRHHQLQAIIRRDKPYKHLNFKAELNCRPESALYQGGNLETLAFKGLEIYACPDNDTAPCQGPWERRNLESLADNYLAEGLPDKNATPHTVFWDQAVNLADEASTEVNGWRVLHPEDPDQSAVLRLKFRPGERVMFFPRLSGPQSLIQAKLLENGQPGPRVFFLVGSAEKWTPIGARYELDLPPGLGEASLEITLQGRFTQLWHKGQAVLFQP